MSYMFKDCKQLEKIDLSNFKTKEATKMKGVFKGCKSLKSLDLSSFDTNNVSDMSKMFKNCSSLAFLNLANFKTTKLKNIEEIFKQCNENLFIYMSNTKMNQIDDIYKKLYFNIKYGTLNLSDLEKIYKELNNRGEKYISELQASQAFLCYEEAFFISEILNDNFKINESECNKGICYFYLNKIQKAFESLVCYNYCCKNINIQKNIDVFCKLGAYFCLCKIALCHKKEECIILIINVIIIISKEEDLNKKKLYLNVIKNILFNIDTLSLINNINIVNYSEPELNIIQEKNKEINKLKKLLNESFYKYLETDKLEEWINSLDITYQKINKLKCKTEIDKNLFHLNKAKSLKNIKKKNDKDEEINFSVNIYSKKEKHSLNSPLNKNKSKTQVIKTEPGIKSNLLKNNDNFENSSDEEESNPNESIIKFDDFDNESILYPDFLKNQINHKKNINKTKYKNEIKNDNEDLNISNKNKDDDYEYKLSIIKEIYKIINSYDNNLKKSKEDIRLYEEKKTTEMLKIFFEKAFNHIYNGESITKINMKSKGSKAHIFRLENATGHLLYLNGSIYKAPKKEFDLNRIIKMKIGMETKNVIEKLNIVKLASKNKNKPYRFISFILSVNNKKKETKSLDLVFNKTKSALKWFYGLFYFFKRENMSYKICSCTNYILKRIKSKMMYKLKINMSKMNENSFANCIIRYFK